MPVCHETALGSNVGYWRFPDCPAHLGDRQLLGRTCQSRKRAGHRQVYGGFTLEAAGRASESKGRCHIPVAPLLPPA
mgnify:CR=1 FL=1